MRHAWLTALVLLVPALPAPAQVPLRWKFKPGDAFAVEEKSENQQKLKLSGSEERRDLDETRVSRFKVLKTTPDGGAILEQKVESVKVVPAGVGVKADASVLKQLEGATFTITLDGRGKVVKLDGYDKFVAAVTRANPDEAKMLRRLLTEENLRRPLDLLFGFGPEKPVTRGAKWQLASQVPFGPFGMLQLTDHYTFEDDKLPDKGVVKLSTSTAITYKLPEPGGLPFKVVGGDVRVKESKGDIFFNADTGRLVRREGHEFLRGVFTLAMDSRRLEMVIEQEQTRTVRVLDSPPAPK
jgi:hypothetical protein